MKGQESYASGTKETWRGWAWNRIIEHLPGYKPWLGKGALSRLCEDKVAVYLPGPDDFDRQAALSKGFRNENLIAVDVCSERIASVRKHGGIGLQGTLQEVLLHWSPTMRCDVVVADLCCGMTEDVWRLGEAIVVAMRSPGVVAANLLRGRDAGSNWMREQNAEIERRCVTKGISPLECKYLGKHRGWEFLLGFIWNLLDSRGVENAAVRGTVERWMTYFHPKFYSYRSPESRQWFDGIVFRWGGRGEVDPSVIQKVADRLPRRLRRAGNVPGKLAALQAVRTKKAMIV